jgi:hypothetical protein
MIRLNRKTGQIVSLCALALLVTTVAVRADQSLLCCSSIAGSTSPTGGKTAPGGASDGATLLGCIFTDSAVANQCPIAARCPTFLCQGPSSTSPPPNIIVGKGTVAKDCTCGQITTPATSCPTGQTLCSGTCLNLESDDNNCGTCGFACGPNNVCYLGVCYGLGTVEK